MKRFSYFIAVLLLSNTAYAGGGKDSPTESNSFTTPSTVISISTDTEQPIDDIVIMPGFGQGVYQYERLTENLVHESNRVGILLARSHDGIGIDPSDLSESLSVFRGSKSRAPVAIVHSISTVWMLQYLQGLAKGKRNVRGVIITNPVLQSPLPFHESWSANSALRDEAMQVHVRLGQERHFRDITVDESAGHIRDLMRSFKRTLKSTDWPGDVPIAVFHDVRDPVLRGKANKAMQFFADLAAEGYPVRIIEGALSDRADVHNLLHDPGFVKKNILRGRYRKLISRNMTIQSMGRAACRQQLRSIEIANMPKRLPPGRGRIPPERKADHTKWGR